MTAVIHLAIMRDTLLTSNMRLHWRTKADRTRAIRDMAHVMARHTRPAKMQAATCVVEVQWPDNRVRDAANLEPTAKAAIDGIVGDYGLLPSDSDRHLKAVTFTASDERTTLPGVAAYLTFTFEEVPG
jgi:hypothetical protein